MALDDRKRMHAVKVLLTERELFDLAREAERDDRKTSDMAHHLIRRSLYGSVDGRCDGDQSFRGSESSPEDA
jgi:hypothetical protein